MNFDLAKDIGYYFDRCIDLVFYDSEMNFIGSLKTPKHGLKPTITVKGLFIEGGYAVDSYISIQNMSFDIDVTYIGFIKARMYYSGLEESISAVSKIFNLNQGHTILYRVLYVDQEKEPPNRCVRFQCVVASKDMSMYNTRMYVTGGAVNYLAKGVDANNLISVEPNKKGTKVPLKKLCEELITVYNTGVLLNSETGKKIDYFDGIKINFLEIEDKLEEQNVPLSSGAYNIGDFVRQLNSTCTETAPNGMSYSKFKIVIDRGCVRVSTPIPNNWEEIAKSKGVDKEKFYNDNYASAKTNVYRIIGSALSKETVNPVIPLNFVKNATRSEGVIYAETLFDDRITPGCHVAIKSNAIMGKKFGSSKNSKGGSRLINFLDKEKPVVFRNTGKIEYLFSTTEDSYMKLQGPVDESVEAQEWSKQWSSIYE